MSDPDVCPLCDAPLFGWFVLPGSGEVLDRCDTCRAGVKRGVAPIDLGRELRALVVREESGVMTLAGANRASVQATLGGEGWAAAAEMPGRLLLTPRALALLAERTGHSLERASYTRLGRNQRWMWQTMLNGLTLHPNFIHDVRARRLRPGSGRGRAAFAIDLVVSVLATPLVALVAVPLELGASLARRGGEIVAELRQAG